MCEGFSRYRTRESYDETTLLSLPNAFNALIVYTFILSQLFSVDYFR